MTMTTKNCFQELKPRKEARDLSDQLADLGLDPDDLSALADDSGDDSDDSEQDSKKPSRVEKAMVKTNQNVSAQRSSKDTTDKSFTLGTCVSDAAEQIAVRNPNTIHGKGLGGNKSAPPYPPK
jgi:hypothetical protein